jgi:hypothetical protein
MDDNRGKPGFSQPEEGVENERQGPRRIAGDVPGAMPQVKRETNNNDFRPGTAQPGGSDPVRSGKGHLAVPKGTPRPSIARQKPLFDDEFAPPEEKPESLSRPKPEQKSLFGVKKFSRSDFRAQGLKGFDNVNTWLTKVQPFVEKGYVIEYGHKGGRNGWARVVKIKKPGKGRLISKAAAPTFVKPEPLQGKLPGEPG